MHGPVIIAMVTVRMVQTTVYEIVDMVAMRHRFMSAVWTVRVRATELRRALHRICGGDPDGMLVHVILVHMVEMAVMKIIYMPVVSDRGVPAVGAVLMSVVGVVLFGARVHLFCSSEDLVALPTA